MSSMKRILFILLVMALREASPESVTKKASDWVEPMIEVNGVWIEKYSFNPVVSHLEYCEEDVKMITRGLSILDGSNRDFIIGRDITEEALIDLMRDSCRRIAKCLESTRIEYIRKLEEGGSDD